MIAFIGLVGAMLLLIAVWGVEGWFAYEVAVLDERQFDDGRDESDWVRLRDEQYANLGDPVGNGTIYAAAREAAAAGGGYRYATEARDVLVIPIHEAMARVANQFGGGQVTAEQMRQLDAAPVHLVNEAYANYMAPTVPSRGNGGSGQDEPREGPTTRPAGGH